MKMPVALAFSLLFAAASAPPADAGEQRRDQREAFDARRQGRILPLREIEQRVVPSMPGSQYLGFDFEAETAIYTLKFVRDGVVIWVEVDGRSGQVVGRTGR
ncbi:hypothetical protein [Sphingomonas immobilis]|uniref:PepSY domain-containing protein n=1 Tax=Sphingomonas immobilis TaxID=3063997 RepID=A0ABT9A4S1_9SPHN|nr:hypothetical protein [Sphingomonas sp. CA1-15]MDO7844533.1 hypothetical protein [Sphingomonas sp. CA1-15]